MATPQQQPAELEAALAAAATALAAAKRVVVLTGAGVSAESGIATFRGERSSVWSGVTGAIGLAVYGTPFGWGIAPGLGWKVFVKHFYAPIARAQPNAAHRALADLAGVRRRKPTTIVTQNVDGLHQAAGSAPETVHEIHGSVRRFRCVAHGHLVTPPPETLEVGGPVPYCTAEGCRSALRPDAVLFTENLPGQEWKASDLECRLLRAGDVMLVVGTSGTVYPAAELPQTAAEKGAHIIECNMARTPLSSLRADDPDGMRHLFLGGGAATVLPDLVARVRAILRAPRNDAQDDDSAASDT